MYSGQAPNVFVASSYCIRRRPRTFSGQAPNVFGAGPEFLRGRAYLELLYATMDRMERPTLDKQL